jgi:hypothetical protein
VRVFKQRLRLHANFAVKSGMVAAPEQQPV